MPLCHIRISVCNYNDIAALTHYAAFQEITMTFFFFPQTKQNRCIPQQFPLINSSQNLLIHHTVYQVAESQIDSSSIF